MINLTKLTYPGLLAEEGFFRFLPVPTDALAVPSIGGSFRAEVISWRKTPRGVS